MKRAIVPLDDQLCFALYACTNALTRAYGPLLAPLGITYLQYLVILILLEDKNKAGVTVGAVGDRLGLDSGTLTPLLKRLEAAGLVERTRATDDERVVRVTLTRSGRSLEAKIFELQRELVCRTGLDIKELIELRDAAQALRRHLVD